MENKTERNKEKANKNFNNQSLSMCQSTYYKNFGCRTWTSVAADPSFAHWFKFYIQHFCNTLIWLWKPSGTQSNKLIKRSDFSLQQNKQKQIIAQFYGSFVPFTKSYPSILVPLKLKVTFEALCNFWSPQNRAIHVVSYLLVLI